MARSMYDLITRVRQILQDQASDAYRYPDEDLIDAFNDGVQETYRIRPDLFIGQFGDELPEIPRDLNDYTTVRFPLPAICFTALVDWTIGRVQARDDESGNSSRATAFMSSFVQKLVGTA